MSACVFYRGAMRFDQILHAAVRSRESEPDLEGGLISA